MGIIKVARLLLFDISLVRASCLTGGDFSSRFASRVITPILLPLVYFVCYAVSIQLNRFFPTFPPMQFAKILNVIGMIAQVRQSKGA